MEEAISFNCFEQRVKDLWNAIKVIEQVIPCIRELSISEREVSEREVKKKKLSKDISNLEATIQLLGERKEVDSNLDSFLTELEQESIENSYSHTGASLKVKELLEVVQNYLQYCESFTWINTEMARELAIEYVESDIETSSDAVNDTFWAMLLLCFNRALTYKQRKAISYAFIHDFSPHSQESKILKKIEGEPAKVLEMIKES